MKDVRKGSSSSTSNNHISFSLGPSSSSRFLPQIAENENELHDSTFNGLKRSRDGGLKISHSQVHLDSNTFILIIVFFLIFWNFHHSANALIYL